MLTRCLRRRPSSSKCQLRCSARTGWTFPLPDVRTIRLVAMNAASATQDVDHLVVVVERQISCLQNLRAVLVHVTCAGCLAATAGEPQLCSRLGGGLGLFRWRPGDSEYLALDLCQGDYGRRQLGHKRLQNTPVGSRGRSGTGQGEHRGRSEVTLRHDDVHLSCHSGLVQRHARRRSSPVASIWGRWLFSFLSRSLASISSDR